MVGICFHTLMLPSFESFCFSAGGVVLATKDKRIVCTNTLDARLDIVFNQRLPEIRELVFGAHTRVGA